MLTRGQRGGGLATLMHHMDVLKKVGIVSVGRGFPETAEKQRPR